MDDARGVKTERGESTDAICTCGGRNSMNCYRLAAHFASRSCDGLVKRFGLSSFNLSPASSSSSCTNTNATPTPTSSRRAMFFFFHCARAPPRHPAGVVKRVTGVVGHSGFSKRKTSHENACWLGFPLESGHGVAGETKEESRTRGFIKFFTIELSDLYKRVQKEL